MVCVVMAAWLRERRLGKAIPLWLLRNTKTTTLKLVGLALISQNNLFYSSREMMKLSSYVVHQSPKIQGFEICWQTTGPSHLSIFYYELENSSNSTT